jgi:hypothetical protein
MIHEPRRYVACITWHSESLLSDTVEYSNVHDHGQLGQQLRAIPNSQTLTSLRK